MCINPSHFFTTINQCQRNKISSPIKYHVGVELSKTNWIIVIYKGKTCTHLIKNGCCKLALVEIFTELKRCGPELNEFHCKCRIVFCASCLPPPLGMVADMHMFFLEHKNPFFLFLNIFSWRKVRNVPQNRTHVVFFLIKAQHGVLLLKTFQYFHPLILCVKSRHNFAIGGS